MLGNIITLIYLFVFNSRDLENKNKTLKIQNRNIRALMKRAYKIPFYRKKFDECGLLPKDFKCAEDLEKFPLLKKEELRAFIKETVSSDEKKYKKYFTVSTSGSSGTPLTMYLSEREMAITNANWVRILFKQHYNHFFGKTMAIKSPHVAAKSHDSILQYFGILRRKTVSYLMSGKELVEEYNNYKPDCLYGHKSKLLEMAMYAKKEGISLHQPKCFASTSEKLDDASVKVLKEAFGENIFDSYGSIETGAITYTAKGNVRKHFILHDTHVVNIIGEDKGSSAGRAIITNTFIREMPVINYDIGDYIETFEQGGLRCISSIGGRLNDWIICADGSRINFQPFSLVMQKINDIFQFRVIQHSVNLLRIQLVADEGADQKAVEERINRELGAVLPDNFSFEFEWMERIPADENGKTRAIISLIKDEEK